MAPRTVLIIDDNAQNLKLARVLLSKNGFDVSTAIDAEEAVRLIDIAPPRLILMDLQLPGMDGFELTRRLKANPTTRHITIIAVTAYAMKGDASRALEAGCDGYIAKPIDTRTLPGVISGYLDRSGPALAN